MSEWKKVRLRDDNITARTFASVPEQDPWQQEVQEMKRKLQWMEETEMAVVVSLEQNEIQTFRKWRLDITPHREKMEKRELDKEFKDADSKLRVVFVCAPA
ncbi:MAG: hypothetical protein ACI3ZD_02365 [Prevotella sp.]